MKKIIVNISLLAGILVIGLIGSYFILNKAHPVSLKADPVSWAVEKSLQSSSAGSYQPIEGKDYTITRVKYFESKQWAIAYTAPIGTFSDSEIVVLEKEGSDYQTRLGPGNSFVGANFSGLPADVVNYLNPSSSQGKSQ